MITNKRAYWFGVAKEHAKDIGAWFRSNHKRIARYPLIATIRCLWWSLFPPK